MQTLINFMGIVNLETKEHNLASKRENYKNKVVAAVTTINQNPF